MVLRDSLPARLSWRSALIAMGLGLLALPAGLRGGDAEAPAYEYALAAALEAEAAEAAVEAPPAEPLYHELRPDADHLHMLPGTSRALTVDQAIPKAQVDNPDVLGLTPLSPTQIQFDAKWPGQTRVRLWNENESVHTIDVTISGDRQYVLHLTIVDSDPDGKRTVLAEPRIVTLEGQVAKLVCGAEVPLPEAAEPTEWLRHVIVFQGKIYREKGQTRLDATIRLTEVPKADASGFRLTTRETRQVQEITLGEKIVVPLAGSRADGKQTCLELIVEQVSGVPPAGAGAAGLPSTSRRLKSVPTLPPRPYGPRGRSLANKLWRLLGLRLGPASLDTVLGRYRGGLEVTEVRQGSPAEKGHIRRGDVLVGLHLWETASLDNVEHALSRVRDEEISPLKFYLIRGKETLYGYLDVPAAKKL